MLLSVDGNFSRETLHVTSFAFVFWIFSGCNWGSLTSLSRHLKTATQHVLEREERELVVDRSKGRYHLQFEDI